MRRRAPYLLAALAIAAQAVAVAADAPDRSIRPDPRPTPAANVADQQAPSAGAEALPDAAAPAGEPRPARVLMSATALAPSASVRPAARAVAAVPRAAPVAADTAPAQPSAAVPGSSVPPGIAGLVFNGSTGTRLATAQSPRPGLRPNGLVERVRASATRQTPGRVTQQGRRGSLCGMPGLVGERLEPIPGRIRGCGIAEPVRLRSVDGIALSTPATINCETARALQTWVQRSLVPAVGRRGGGVASLRVVASYACRTRNNQPGARVSEHGRGNAIDIAGIGLANGTELTVLTGWRDNRAGPILREVHRGACGPFGTVLGPNSDRFHQDHFHFDVASYRSGPYCR